MLFVNEKRNPKKNQRIMMPRYKKIIKFNNFQKERNNIKIRKKKITKKGILEGLF